MGRHNLRAVMHMQDKSTTEMAALNGLYNSKSETLRLDQDILLTSSIGY